MTTASKLIIASLMISNLVFIGLYCVDKPAASETLIVESKPSISKTTSINHDAQLHALQQKLADLQQTLNKERRQYQVAIQQWQQAQANAVLVKTTSINDTHAFVDSYLNNPQRDNSGKLILVGNVLSKWQETIQAALVEKITSETSPKKLLQLTQQLKSLNLKDSLKDEISQKLLQNTLHLKAEQQSDMLASLEGKITANVLNDLEPLLYSSHAEIAEEAFLRLEEMGVNTSTKAYFEQLAVNSPSEWVRNQASKMTSKL
jgi:hypothetical protein